MTDASEKPIRRLSELIDVEPRERIREELRILEGLMAQAIRDKDWTGSLKIFESAHEILKRAPRA